MLKKQEGKQIFPLVRKNLRLIVEDLDEQNPNDIAYVYSGYAPLSVRLVQQAVRGGWRQHDELLRALPGAPPFEETQSLPPGVVLPSDRPPVTLVFFIGGITFTEIAALRYVEHILSAYSNSVFRYLSAQDAPNRDYIIATTKLINGDSIIDSVIERIEPPAQRR